MKKRVSILASLICLLLLAGACSKSEDSANTSFGSGTDKEKSYQGNLDIIRPMAYSSVENLNLEKGTYLSVIGKGSDTAYWKSVEEGVKQAAKDLNKELGYKGDDKIKVSYNAPSKTDNVDEQVNILDEELARYPAALAIAVTDSSACEVQFDLAAENNIPIVEFDSGSNYKGITAMCSTDNKEAAQSIAKKLAASIDDKGEIAVFVHDSVSTTGQERKKAFLEEIKQNHPEVSVVNVYHLDELDTLAETIAKEKNAALKKDQQKVSASDITQEEAAEYIFTKHPNIKACFATNVDASQLVVKTLDKLQKKEVTVMGFDGGKEQLAALKDEKISGLLVQNPFGMGYAAVIASARSVLGLPNEAFVNTGYTWVTKDNMDSASIKKLIY